MKRKYLYAGVLAAFMAVSSSFVVCAEPTGSGLESAIEVTTGDNTSAETQEEISGVIEAPVQETTQAIETAAETSAPAETASATVTAGSATVTAGSSTVTAGGAAQSAGSMSAPTPAGSTVTSGGTRVVGAGLGGPGVAGPGMMGEQQQTVEAGNVSFAGSLSSPIVNAVEKYSYDQMCRDIRSLSSRYGDLMHTNVIGTTLDGRSIYEIVLGNTNAGKHILIHAGIHAREYMTPLLVMKQLEHGLAFYNSSSYEGVPLSTLLDQVAIHYVPMVNPDGISLSQFGISAIRSEELRQIINQCYANDIASGRTGAAFDRYLNYWKANGRGVDLNQNFDADWSQVTSITHPSYATYRGTSSVSEPESQALVSLANSRSWALTISYHSMGNIIYWDYQGNKVAGQSLELANLIAGKTGYRLAGSSGHGGFKDWVQIKEGPIPSLTLEVGSVACPMPVSEFTDVWNRNHEVWAASAKYAMEH